MTQTSVPGGPALGETLMLSESAIAFVNGKLNAEFNILKKDNVNIIAETTFFSNANPLSLSISQWLDILHIYALPMRLGMQPIGSY